MLLVRGNQQDALVQELVSQGKGPRPEPEKVLGG